jgi:lipopolysaccharide transport system permease protein
MTKVVYMSSSRVPLARLVSPYWIVRDLMSHRELLFAYAKREFLAVYRETILGVAWSVLTPLILLALFTLVFGYIFHGRFNQAVQETPAEFALALFIGLSLYLCIGQTLTTAPGLMLANATYVKTLSFPLEVLPASAVLNILVNLGIGLALCFIAFFLMHGYIHWTAIFLVPLIVCVGLMCIGLSWFLSSLGVFIRDVPSITSPLSMILMFLSGVFFPIESVPKGIAWFFRINPIAIIVEQARGSFLYGKVPNFTTMAAVLVLSLGVAIGGYWFFIRTKPAFADVI